MISNIFEAAAFYNTVREPVNIAVRAVVYEVASTWAAFRQLGDAFAEMSEQLHQTNKRLKEQAPQIDATLERLSRPPPPGIDVKETHPAPEKIQ